MITKRQKQVLDFITKYQEKHIYAPSLEEISKHFKFASVSTAHFHIETLSEKGFIVKKKNQPRAFSVNKKFFPKSKRISKTNKKTTKPISEFENRIIEGDCLDVLPQIPSESINMILCDLPYGHTQNHWDSIIPLKQLWKEYTRIIKRDGAIVLTASGLFTSMLCMSNEKLFKYKIIWIKSKPTNFLNAKKQPLRKYEEICIFYKNQPKYNPQMSFGEPYNKGYRKDQFSGSYGDFKSVIVKSDGERYPTDVIYFKTAESEGPVYHATQKPVELGRYLVKTFTNENDIVLDNACGSGSFLVAAALEGRKYIGIEKNEEIYLFKKEPIDCIELCNKRIREAQNLYRNSTIDAFQIPVNGISGQAAKIKSNSA